MKNIIVILDGASGWELEELDGQTTLEAAATPMLDLMALQGKVGLAETVFEGLEPSSAAACTSILGFDPATYCIGRAAIEAAAMGITLDDDEVALRVNTLTIENGIMRSYAGGHISTDESRAIIERLAAELDDEVFTLYPGVAYRHILVVKGHPELLETTYTPPHDISDKPVADYLPTDPGAALLADYTARAHALLAHDPTNEARVAAGLLPITDLWPFWPGTAPARLPSFPETFGATAALSSGVDLLFGLARLFGITPLAIDGVTDGPDNDYVAQVTGALAALDEHDVVIIHVESPDEMAHAGDMAGKILAIEDIDQSIMTRVFAYGRQHDDVRVLALPDHPTPIALKTHVRAHVPFLLWGSGVSPDQAVQYSERTATETGWTIAGPSLMGTLLEREDA